jgi:hypothetical protein
VKTPRYPIYVISKGRSDSCLTAKFLIKDGVKFHIVVELQEKELYAERYGEERILVLPFSNLGQGSIPARNWVWEHAKSAGHERHWILDDNMRYTHRVYKGKRIVCNSGIAFSATEDFVDRYENIAIAGLNYSMFIIGNKKTGLPPFYRNVHVYSCLLIKNDIPQRWRGRYNEDTDICLQVLSAGWCTVLMNAFCIMKMKTLTMKGGNMEELYKGDGRLKMARSLERVWPYVVTVGRRFKRPQHMVKNSWRKFDTPLKLKPGIDLSKLPVDEYGMELIQVRPEIKSERLRNMLSGWNSDPDSADKVGVDKIE